ncbi:uncharacterized protein A4U43_C08F14670 [Asparagus officinalis]|nr:uncharacterized protein A4U43_C08F14670 [Asparagus officinalis]
MRLDQPKEGTKNKRVIQILDSPEGPNKNKCINEEGFIPRSRSYPGKTLVYDYENKLIDNFLQLKMTSDTYVWKCAKAIVSHLDVYKLLTGGELSDDVIDAFVIRLCYKIEINNSYDRNIHVTRPWLADLKDRCKEMMAMESQIENAEILEPETEAPSIMAKSFWDIIHEDPTSAVTESKNTMKSTERDFGGKPKTLGFSLVTAIFILVLALLL